MPNISFKLRRGTTAQWAANDPILVVGEPGFDTDLKIIKVGDGVTVWTELTALTGASHNAVAQAYNIANDDGVKSAIASRVATNIENDTNVKAALDSRNLAIDANGASALRIQQDARHKTAQATNISNDAGVKAALRGEVLPKWKANTAYTSGQHVLSPSGRIVSANTGFTSSSTYSAGDWTPTSALSQWTANTAYTSGEHVLNPSGQIVRANTGFTSTGTYNAANWTTVDVESRVASPSGQWVYPGNMTGTASSNVLGNSVNRAVPIVLHRTTVIDALTLSTLSNGQTSCNIRLGLYADNGTGYPGALLLDAGTVPGNVTANHVSPPFADLTLEPGVYWLCAAVQTAPGTQPTIVTCGAAVSSIPIRVGTTPVSTAVVGYTETVVEAFPLTFTSTVTPSLLAPRIGYRIA